MRLSFVLSVFLFCSSVVLGQGLQVPKTSPGAAVTQKVGLGEIKIQYHRPGVKGREIWGDLVPYNQIWRAGANEATTIVFSEDVSIEGKKIASGTYSFFAIPQKEGAWTVVLNQDPKLWGTMGYEAEKDVHRFSVQPQTAPHQEWLSFSFENLATESAEITLRWEKMRLAFTVIFEVHEKVLANARAAMAKLTEGDWRTPFMSAKYCIDNKINVAEASFWIDKSLAVQENAFNLVVKSYFLENEGKIDDAVSACQKAIQLGREDENWKDNEMVQNFLNQEEKRMKKLLSSRN